MGVVFLEQIMHFILQKTTTIMHYILPKTTAFFFIVNQCFSPE